MGVSPRSWQMDLASRGAAVLVAAASDHDEAAHPSCEAGQQSLAQHGGGAGVLGTSRLRFRVP